MEFNHYRESPMEMEDRMLEEKLDSFIEGLRERGIDIQQKIT